MPWFDTASNWEQFMTMLSPGPGEKILDVGAGKGAVASRVLDASRGAALYAVDPSEKAISVIRAKLPKIDASVAPAEKLPFPDSEFDRAYTTMALHHYSDIGTSLKEISRVLKPGGTFLVLESEPRSALGRLFRFFGGLVGEHLQMFTQPQLETKLTESGLFRVVASARLDPQYLVRSERA